MYITSQIASKSQGGLIPTIIKTVEGDVKHPLIETDRVSQSQVTVQLLPELAVGTVCYLQLR